MLSTATHSKLREALDGTDTQVATYTIDRWTAKMKGAEENITREISRRGGRQSERHQKALVVQYQRRRRRTHPRASTDFDPLPNYAVDDPIPQRSCPIVDEVLAKAQFLSPLLYQIHYIRPVGFGFGFACIYSERHPPNRDLTIFVLLFLAMVILPFCDFKHCY